MDNKQDIKSVELPGFGRPEDSRLRGFTGNATHPTLPLERTYCTLCGKEFGWVSVESYEFIRAGEVIVFCNECEEAVRSKIGGVPLEVAALDNATELKPRPEKGKIL